MFDAEWDTRESWPLYRRTFCQMDPSCRTPMAAGHLYDFRSIMAPMPLEDSEYYTRFCRSIDNHHGLFVYLGNRGGIDGWASFARGHSDRDFDNDDADMVRQLLPHLGRALDIHARLSGARTIAALQDFIYAPLGIGLIMVDQAGRVLSTNDIAEALLDRGSPIFRAGGRLGLAGSTSGRLSELISAARHGHASLTAADGERQLHLLAKMCPDHIAGTFDMGSLFIIYVEDRPRANSVSADAVARRFGLTRAEANVAVLLANGKSVDEAAAALGITSASARTYCKRALAKSGARRQADLVQMILTSIARFS